MRKSSTAGVSSLFLSVSFFSFISPAAMASKFRALEAGGLPYATIPSHYFIRSFSNTLTACSFDFRAALISLTYIVRLLLSYSRPVDHY